eukprot:scaffold86948_cov33-Tisochrysis_lutea.AAC.5
MSTDELYEVRRSGPSNSGAMYDRVPSRSNISSRPGATYSATREPSVGTRSQHDLEIGRGRPSKRRGLMVPAVCHAVVWPTAEPTHALATLVCSPQTDQG